MNEKIRRPCMGLLLSVTRGTQIRGRLRLAMALNRILMPADGYVRSKMRSGLEMELDLTDPLQQWFYYLGDYEPAESALIRSILPKNGVFVDVGANVGWHTLLAAAHLDAGGRVYAFEPVEENAHRIRRNLEFNGLTNVTLEVLGLGDRSGSIELLTEFPRSGNATMAHRDVWTRAPITVQTIRFDEYAQRHGLDRIDLIKLDVEGAEMLALRGMTKLLSRPSGPPILCELNPTLLALTGSSPAEVESFFAAHGYEARERFAAPEPLGGHTNVLFTRGV